MRQAVLAVTLAAGAAWAQSDPDMPSTAPAGEGQAWTTVGGRTVGVNKNQLVGGVGWPGLEVSFERGILSMFDLGARATFFYGLEGLVTQVHPGFKLQGLVKVKFLDQGKVALAIVFEPGPLVWGDRGATVWGFTVPFGVRLGIAAASALNVGLSFDVPLWVQFDVGGGLNVPIMTGLGLEYFVKSDLAVFFKTKMGPTIRPYQRTEFTFDAMMGVGYRF